MNEYTAPTAQKLIAIPTALVQQTFATLSSRPAGEVFAALRVLDSMPLSPDKTQAMLRDADLAPMLETLANLPIRLGYPAFVQWLDIGRANGLRIEMPGEPAAAAPTSPQESPAPLNGALPHSETCPTPAT